jgi:hypothetical protein
MVRVLQIPRSDAEDEYVLLYVSSSGSKDLDLLLIGTEGTAPFALTRTLAHQALCHTHTCR